jgi:hypothetical protein
MHINQSCFALLLSFVVCACDSSRPASRDSVAPPQQPGAETSPERAPAESPAAVEASPPRLTRAEIIRARRKYTVGAISFDASQRFGTEMPYSDYVRLRIRNNSEVTLPCLTVLTKRYSNGQMVGSSRAPSIPTADLAPSESVEYNYYPRGHLDVLQVDKIAVEIEAMIDPASEKFFCELQSAKR